MVYLVCMAAESCWKGCSSGEMLVRGTLGLCRKSTCWCAPPVQRATVCMCSFHM
jgi:hypothetical protein